MDNHPRSLVCGGTGRCRRTDRWCEWWTDGRPVHCRCYSLAGLFTDALRRPGTRESDPLAYAVLARRRFALPEIAPSTCRTAPGPADSAPLTGSDSWPCVVRPRWHPERACSSDKSVQSEAIGGGGFPLLLGSTAFLLVIIMRGSGVRALLGRLAWRHLGGDGCVQQCAPGRAGRSACKRPGSEAVRVRLARLGGCAGRNALCFSRVLLREALLSGRTALAPRYRKVPGHLARRSV